MVHTDHLSARGASAISNEFFPKISESAVGSLRPLGRRVRKHSTEQLKKIARSIQRFGLLNPILIDESNCVLAGWARLEAAKMLGSTTVPTIVASHMTATEKRQYRIAENRLAEMAEWDRDALGEELRELALADPEFELEDLGFGTIELDSLLTLRTDAEIDKLPPTPKFATSSQDTEWLLDEHRVSQGDATKSYCVSRLMRKDKARVAFLDAPYNVPIKGHVTSNAAHREFLMAAGEMSDDEFSAFCGSALKNVADLLVDGGIAFWCMDWRHMHNSLEAQRAANMSLLNLCVWTKPQGGMGSFFRSQHELVFVFKAGSAQHLNRVQLGKHGRNRSNVWAYDGVSGLNRGSMADHADHPTPKPVAMIEDALLDCSERGDIVVDVFGGGGSTLLAAERTGRRARILELDPLYVDVIVERWQGFTGRDAIHAETGLTYHEMRSRSASPLLLPAPSERPTDSDRSAQS